MLRIEPLKEDQAPSAILELVDGPKDMRFAMTARTIARCRGEGKDINEMTQRNIDKVTRFRPSGGSQLESMVNKLNNLEIGARDDYKEEQAKEMPTWGKNEDGKVLKKVKFWARENAKSDEKRWGGKV